LIKKLSALMAVLAVTALVTVLGAAGPARAAPTTTASATVTLLGMTPRTPDAQTLTQAVRITARITNNTDTSYSDVQFSLERATTISQQPLLDQTIANPVTGNDTDFEVQPPLDLHKPLGPHASVTVSYLTSVQALCLCYHGIYPYSLVASGISDPNQGFTELGRTQVLLPSFPQSPQPVRVAWIWPLLDRPHRSVDSDVFLDESLAGEISPGGRLDRALRVPELVAGKVPVTLVVDPDLLDSLAVMAGPQGYRVRKGVGTVAGTGGAVARAWLARFKTVADEQSVVLTSFADPDVNALARNGQSYSTALDGQVRARIAPYLQGASVSSQLAWPAGEALTSRALDTLVGGGVSSVLLSDAALPGGRSQQPPPDAISPLPTAAGQANALVLSTELEATFKRAVKLGTATANDGQNLIAQLAVRAEEAPDRPHFVVLAPERYVNANPGAAASVMVGVGATGWSESISLSQALATITPVDHGSLNTAAENPAAEISQRQLNQLNNISDAVSSMNEALHDNDAAAQLLAGFNTGILRGESSAWRGNPSGGATVVRQLQDRIDGITGSVHLVTPAVGTYSLSSANSPIVVTVANQLRKPVTVQVVLRLAEPGIGFSTPAQTTTTVPAQGMETVRVPSHTERLGQFRVIASLQTPDGRGLGTPIELNVRATAIGTVTKIITAVAVAVLVLLLLRRLVRRLRHGPRNQRSALRVGTA